ncbi:hypothetical protein D3C75_961510 [compost metagenome]
MARQRGKRVGGHWPWKAVAQEWIGVFGAFTGAQPTSVHTEQIGQFVQPGQRYTAFEPVVDVLCCDAALGGEIGRG